MPLYKIFSKNIYTQQYTEYELVIISVAKIDVGVAVAVAVAAAISAVHPWALFYLNCVSKATWKKVRYVSLSFRSVPFRSIPFEYQRTFFQPKNCEIRLETRLC